MGSCPFWFPAILANKYCRIVVVSTMNSFHCYVLSVQYPLQFARDLICYILLSKLVSKQVSK